MSEADLVCANPDALDAYSQTTTAADDGVTSDVDAYGSAWSTFTAGPFVPPLTLPVAKYDQLANLVDQLRTLDGEPAALASALRTLDMNGDGALDANDDVDPALLNAYVSEYQKDPNAFTQALRARAELFLATGVELFTVTVTEGGTRVVTMNMEALGPLEGLTDEELQALLVAYGLTGENGGPVHFVMHGLASSSSEAAANTAAMYDEMGIEGATVVAINWDADFLTQYPYRTAEDNARDTGDAMARVFTQIAAANPDANVAVTAHSLGNHVALRALSQMEDPTGTFSVDYTGIQPAIPTNAYADDPENYGALVNGRIEHLTLSINDNDMALGAHEALYAVLELGGNPALGDETADSEAIQDIMSLREEAGLDTVLIDHNSGAGFGHLTIDPEGDSLTESLYREQIDRVANGENVSAYTEAREQVYDVVAEQPLNMYGRSADELFESAPVQGYLDYCADNGLEPDPDRVAEIAQEEIDRGNPATAVADYERDQENDQMAPIGRAVVP